MDAAPKSTKIELQANAVDKQTKELAWQICCLAGSPTLIADIRKDLAEQGVVGALRNGDTPTLYNWMVRSLAYQGISDQVASTYMEQHGSITWQEIEAKLSDAPKCAKLKSYWHFHSCGYTKSRGTCNEPALLSTCPLPRHPLRNGRLNQSAYGLYLFMRDIADRDFVRWLDITSDARAYPQEQRSAPIEALLGPMRNLLGMSDKMLSMMLSGILIAGAPERLHWLEIGAGMIVIDTLVHNFLHRTGILRRHGSNHRYGPSCYRPGGCASILRDLAGEIDARQFNPNFPQNFPRFIQRASHTVSGSLFWYADDNVMPRLVYPLQPGSLITVEELASPVLPTPTPVLAVGLDAETARLGTSLLRIAADAPNNFANIRPTGCRIVADTRMCPSSIQVPGAASTEVWVERNGSTTVEIELGSELPKADAQALYNRFMKSLKALWPNAQMREKTSKRSGLPYLEFQLTDRADFSLDFNGQEDKHRVSITITPVN